MATNKGTWQDFLGINAISDPYKYKVASNLIQRELGGVSNGYNIVNAGTGNSGWSFGGHQMDVGNNTNAAALLQKIVDHQHGDGYYNTIKPQVEMIKNPNSLDATTKNKIDVALSSDYGKQQINQQFVKDINNITYHINNVESSLGIKLSQGEKLMLADYHNQYGLSITNSSSAKYMINKLKNVLEQKGDLTIDDIAAQMKTTKYYKDHPKV